MSDKKLENVHVSIYSRKMLKQAVDRLKNLNQKVEDNILSEFEHHGNDLLRYHNGIFVVVHHLYDHPNFEITLNDLCEMIIDLEENQPIKHVIGKWYKNDYGSIVNYQGGRSGFGLASDGDWYNNNYWSFESFKYEATDQEVSGMLIKEAQKRGFKGGVKFSLGKYVYEMPHKLTFKYFPKGNTLGANHVTIPHLFPQIFNNGKWAEIVEQDKFAELKEAYNDGSVIERKVQMGWVIDLYPQWDYKVEYRIKLEEPKLKIGDYAIFWLETHIDYGFSVMKIVEQHSADYYNQDDCPHSFKIITKDKFDELRKELLCTTS